MSELLRKGVPDVFWVCAQELLGAITAYPGTVIHITDEQEFALRVSTPTGTWLEWQKAAASLGNRGAIAVVDGRVLVRTRATFPHITVQEVAP